MPVTWVDSSYGFAPRTRRPERGPGRPEAPAGSQVTVRGGGGRRRAGGGAMARSKPRILPWLREQLDSGLLGARWLDAERRRFLVPWKHGLRQDLHHSDFGIFQAWAEASGSYRPGIDPPDPATWKRNFRAALDRKKEALRLVSNHSRDPRDPHKVYEFLRGAGEGREEPEDQEEIIPRILGALSLAPQQQEEEIPEVFSPNEILEQLPQSPEPAPPGNPLGPLFASNESEYEVTVFYRGRQVLQQCLSCLKGLRLVGPRPAPEAEACMELDAKLVLPEPGEKLADQKTAQFIDKVLRSLGAGLTLWTSQNELRAQRLGHCRTYWATGEQTSPGAPWREVTKDRYGQQVYNIPQFVNDLISFLEGSHRSPQYTLWFCLGEQWPMDSQLWTKKLVMIKVVPTALRALHETAQIQGASSLEEVDLHISGSFSLPLAPAQLHDCLQELVHSMHWEPGHQC
ncbi:interferon regulatory factor 3 [Macrotis lagotis]|uniref:interferon regulatory factor 3 n=1 Tax=Macrotis lagotis TaxID=92651 RepID=UPI003D691874